MIDHDCPRIFAVLDPRLPANLEMIQALGSDAVELEGLLPGCPENPLPVYRVRLGAIRLGRLVAVCRLIARREGITFDLTFATAIQRGGIAISPLHCRLCADPEVGREYFARRRREEGP